MRKRKGFEQPHSQSLSKMDPDRHEVLFYICRIRGNYCQLRKQIVALSTSSSSCQQSFSLACSILAYSRKTLDELSKISVEHERHVARM